MPTPPKGMTREEYEAACERADKRMKATNGHSFETMLKTRCVYCRRSPRAKGKCRGWFMTFINHLYYELTSPESDASLQALAGDSRVQEASEFFNNDQDKTANDQPHEPPMSGGPL